MACELSQIPYSFSPWGVGTISSSSSQDMITHPNSLCGSIAQYIPTDDEKELQHIINKKRNSSEFAVSSTDEQLSLFYINGRAAVKPNPLSVEELRFEDLRNFYNEYPTHVTKRSKRVVVPKVEFGMECLTNLGSVPLSNDFFNVVLQRRRDYTLVSLQFYEEDEEIMRI